METARIAIVGAGNRGIFSFGKLLQARPDVRLVGLADANPARIESARQLLGIDLPGFADPETLCNETQPDGVVVATPDHLHAAHAQAVLAQGVKHLLVEKPLATTAPAALGVARAAQAAGAQLTIGFNLRCVPVIARVKQLIDDGAIGRVMLIENREFYDGGRTYMARWNRRYRLSGGLWVHKGTHDFDVFHWWNAGGDPVAVSCAAGLSALRPDRIPFPVAPDKPVGPTCRACAYADACPDRVPPPSTLFSTENAASDGYHPDECLYLSEKDTHDNGIALVQYDNDVRASHLECFVSNFTDRSYTIVGDRGVIEASLSRPDALRLRPRWGSDQEIDVPPASEGGHSGSDPLLVERFVRRIFGEETPGAGVRDGVKAVAVGQAAEIAWRTGRTVALNELLDLNDPAL